MIRRTALAVVAVVAMTATPPGLAQASPALPDGAPTHAAPTATAARCAPIPASVTSEQAERAWAIAGDRLARRSRLDSLPFGATGSSPYIRTGASSWTSGFYPASLWLMYEHTADPAWLGRARAFTERVVPMATARWTHDLGFMVGLPAGLGARLDPDPDRRDAYARARDTAARSLATRWNGRVRALRSATYSGRWGLIIDSAMNAPMLIESGMARTTALQRRLANRGARHMRTLARAFVRADGSTAHRQSFNPGTGRLQGPLPGQGRSGSSTWSRGQAWAINGFTRGYALTGDPRMLDAARRTADHWVSRVAAGCVPAWDLDVTGPHEPLDSSAAAIAVDGLLQLAEADPDRDRGRGYRSYAMTTLATLVSPPFVTERGRGLLRRQSYSIPLDRREGTYAWGDAYLLSALARAFATPHSQRSMTSTTS